MSHRSQRSIAWGAALALAGCGAVTTTDEPNAPPPIPTPIGHPTDPGSPTPPQPAGTPRLVLLDGYDAHLYASDDGGAAWFEVGTVPLDAPAIVSFAVRAGGEYVATTTLGTVIVSADRGQSWSPRPAAPWGSDGTTGGPANFVQLAPGAEGELIATSTHYGRPGRVYGSVDGALTWKLLGTWPMETGMMTGLAADGAGTIYVSHPPYLGGQVYTGQPSALALAGSIQPTPTGAVALIERLPDSGLLVAVGTPETTFLRSLDGGGDWSAGGAWIDPRGIAGLAALRDELVVAVSVKGPVLRSADLGESWEVVGDWGEAADRDLLCCSGWIDLGVE